jgi:hypothetical protein
VKRVETRIKEIFLFLEKLKNKIHTCIRPWDDGSFSLSISPIGEDI